MYFLDTNIVVWLAQGEVEKLSPKVAKIIESNDIFISPLVKLELEYLNEIKRIKIKSEKLIKELYDVIGLQVHNVPLTVLIEQSLQEKWTRDPFDRLIVSHAKCEKAFLLTKDKIILNHYEKAIWN